MSKEIEGFVRDFLKELEEDNVAIFAGAGLSTPAGFVNWKDLLRPIAEELDLNVDIETDLVAIAQFHANENSGNRSKLNQLLIDNLSVGTRVTVNHQILASLPISTYWTTNYDKLIEKSLDEASKIADVKYVTEQLATTKRSRDAVVYKMHGDVDHPHHAVLTKDDYEKYHVDRGAFINALSGDLISKTFLFIGFSFSDPNLDYILSRVRVTFRDNQRRHYCFFKRRTRLSDDTDESFEHAKVKQRLMIGDLKRFNIKVILVDEYYEITEALRRIELLYRRRTVFISGSAVDYSPWEKSDVDNFLRDFGSSLVKEGYRLASGVGLGIGDPVLSGAIERIYQDRKAHIEDALIIRPFPRANPDKAVRDKLWDRYRRDLIKTAGICVILFGNKEVGGKVVPADGVHKEFDIARELGLIVVPVAATGNVAQDIHRQIAADPGTFYPDIDSSVVKAIMDISVKPKNLDDLLTSILKVIKLINRR
jgi:hypothetical protein